MNYVRARWPRLAGFSIAALASALFFDVGPARAQMTPILLTGFNRDVVIESNAVAPFNNYAGEFNGGENTCFYQQGLPGTTFGMPASGQFLSEFDSSTIFQFQPYTANNALVFSSDTGVTNGALTLLAPAIYNSVAVIASSASATATSAGQLTFQFSDGTTFVTNYAAPDWFRNTGFALEGVDRINLASGVANGGATTNGNPRFYQTTVNLAAIFGSTNKPLAALLFTKATNTGGAQVNTTGIFAASGTLSVSNSFSLATVTNGPATNLLPNAATLTGGVAATGGYIPTVTIYFGSTNGGTNASAWTSSAALGYQTNKFSFNVTNLVAGGTYYYTVQASNVAGVSWATPSQSFKTPVTPIAATPTISPASQVLTGSTVTFNVSVAGASPFHYQWQTNGGNLTGATNSSLVLTNAAVSMSGSYDVVVTNAFGATTSAAVVLTVSAQPPPASFGNGANWAIVQTGTTTGNIASNVFHGTDGGGAEAVAAWYGTPVYVNGFTASFIYQDVGGAIGANADGATFTLQEMGTNYIGADGGALGVSGLTPSANWEFNLYQPNGIGIIYTSNGGSGGYLPTDPVNVSSGDPISVTIVYAAGGAVQETLVDTVTSATYVTNYNIGDITALLGSSTAYVGFTTTDGGVSAVQTISGFTFQAGANSFTPALVTNLAATGIAAEAATLNGQVVSNGGSAPTITFYYGTTDGGTNAASWANSISVGYQSGSYSASISTLSPGTKYYFTASSANIGGVSWASPSLSFTTPGVTPPQIANSAATGVGATLATLNGQVTATGGAAPAVTLYYGTSDGGTVASAWANSISIGAQTGAYAQTIGSLSSNTTYYFTAQASNNAGIVWATPSANFTTLGTNPVSTLTAVLTYHNDNTRWGVNSNETTLTPQNVNTNSFGKLFTYTLDGFVYAQPLIMTNVSIPGKGTHNVIYVATEHNSVYALDADSNAGANASPLWQTSFLGPNVATVPAGSVGSSDITPEIGITSTPVIDASSGTIYLEVKTFENNTTYVHRLHALDIATGLERTNFHSPMVITYTNYPGNGGGDNDGKGHVNWNPLREHSRPALTLLNGVVYMSFASHGDTTPYHGWLFGYNATNFAITPSAYNSTPNGGLGGFWDGGGGLSVDPQGNMFFQTGNGTFDGGATVTATNNYAMSLIKFSTTNGLAMADYFAPSNAVALSGQDADLGSAAPIILPDSAGSLAHPHLVVGGGKTAPIYLVDRDNMGEFNGTTGVNRIVQQFNGGPGGDRDTTPAFFNNTLYIIDGASKIGAYKIANALFNTTPVETPDSYANKGGVTPSISANGTNSGIVWAIYNPGGETPTGSGILRAYNATNLNLELYSSDQLASRDGGPGPVKFIAPTIANGKVYVGGQYAVSVYGLATVFVNAPVISPNGGVFTNSVTVTLSDSTTGAAIYYTLDGTPATTNSTLYTKPFTLTNSTVVTASAFKAGAVSSGSSSASFINSSSIGTGTGLQGQYFANTTSAAFANAGYKGTPTLTRVDPTINFNWGTTAPDPSIGLTVYCVRWTGSIQPQFNETYTFSTTTDDGVRLLVNGQLLVNEWVDQGPTTWSGQIKLNAQQRYNIEMDYYQNGGGAVAQLQWSSPSTGPATIVPQSQLYPVTNPPPQVALVTPAPGATFVASASVSLTADAAAQFNSLTGVSFYAGSTFLGTVTNAPYAVTATGLAAGNYALTAVATDGSGLSATSAPVNITVTAGTGQAYGLSNAVAAPAFFNMPTTFNGVLPAKLSLTGVFTNTPAMSPAGSFIPYAPNTPLWSDGAQKLRYFSVPNNGAPLTPGEQIAFAPTNTWTFPAGTVFVKTFELLTNTSDPNSLLRLETRLLVRDVNGAVYGVTYKWRADNSDADLLTTNLTQLVPIQTPGGVVTQSWYYPSPSDCLQCHTAPANYVLGLNARQLNATFTYPNGVTDNELRALNRAGLFYPAISEGQIPNIEQLSAITNTSASLTQRVRSYLDANCAQCHQPGGSGPTFDARYDTPLTNQNLINVPAVKGNLGFDNVNIVTPNDVWRSSLYDRMNSLDPAIKMPPLARNLIDTNAVQVMAQWINSLGGTPTLPPPTLAPSGGTFPGSVNVTIVPPTNNVTLYYTLDGTLPTTNSILYSGPFLVTSNVFVSANAWEPGFVNSVVGSGQFNIVPGIMFVPGAGFTNGVFQMKFAGPTGSNYVLQFSTNLTQWTPIVTNTPGTSPFIFTDPGASNSPYRFYRAIQKP
jgi:uncharacterized repeat protein (TIGR03806 family)